MPAEVGTPEAKPALADRFRWLISRTWFWPTLLTTAAGLFKIGTPELWRDELRSWSAASRSVGDLFHLLGNTDAAVALYYLVLHWWMAIFGDSAVAMRLPSVLFMAGAAAIVALIGQRLFDRRTAIVGGLFFAIIPAVSRFAQEVRPYALAMLIAVLATLLLLRALDKPTWGRWVAYAAAITFLALAQVVAVPLVLGHGVGILLLKTSRSTLIRWGIAVAVGVALAAPVILLSSTQYDHQVGSLPDASLGEITRLPARLFSSGLVAGAILILALLAFTAKWRQAAFLAACAVLPIAAIWVASNLGQSFWMSRYMLFTLPAFALLAAATVSRMGLRTVVVAVAAISFLGAQDQRAMRWEVSHDQWTYPDTENPAVMYSQIAQIISDNMQPGDALAIANRGDYWLLDIGLAYHMRGQEMPRDVFVEQTSVQLGDFWPQECAMPAKCLGNPQRIWVVSMALLSNDPFTEMEGAKSVVILDKYVAAEHWEPTGATVWLMERDPIS